MVLNRGSFSLSEKHISRAKMPRELVEQHKFVSMVCPSKRSIDDCTRYPCSTEKKSIIKIVEKMTEKNATAMHMLSIFTNQSLVNVCNT